MGHAYRTDFKFNPNLGYTVLQNGIKNIFLSLPKEY